MRRAIFWAALIGVAGCTSSASSSVVDGSPGLGDAAVADSRPSDAPVADAPGASGGDGGACGVSLASCLSVDCCAGFVCCTGNPVPPGQATCYFSTCPY